MHGEKIKTDNLCFTFPFCALKYGKDDLKKIKTCQSISGLYEKSSFNSCVFDGTVYQITVCTGLWSVQTDITATSSVRRKNGGFE
jgi:hypothetical protein